jgi:DNA helicase-2/ATP-dependent DNA helicase PcrA
MVSALAAAIESPQIPPEARDRIHGFLRLHSLATRAIDALKPDLFVHRLIERLGLRSSLAYSASPQAAERLRALATFGELASAHVRRDPQATARDFARHIVAIAAAGVDDVGIPIPDGGSPAVEILGMDAVRDREWEHVFVIGLEAGRLPAAANQLAEPLPESILPEQLPGSPDEARSTAARNLNRLAMSRARNRLVLCHARSGSRGETLHPSAFAEEVRLEAAGEWIERETELFAPNETLQATYRILRDELLEVVESTGDKLLELRLDTGEDIDRAVVRFLELLKLSALTGRPDGHGAADSLAAVNERLRAAASDNQRAALETSALDRYILEADRDEKDRERALAARSEPSLEAFLPRRGEGVALSASDIETYRTCPLRYKFARVMRVPQDPTTAQRFGIVMHQVLERWHRGPGGSEAQLLGLFEQTWRRSGLGDGERERQLKTKARTALTRYLERNRERNVEAIWLERPFTFRIGPHILRGRVDRVDRHADGAFELIDYKTSFPKTAEQLRDDIQLTVYSIGARDAWKLDAPRRSYWYVLDDDRVEVPGEIDRDEIEATVHEVAEGILSQGFEPSPSFSACSTCDWQLACPAAES